MQANTEQKALMKYPMTDKGYTPGADTGGVDRVDIHPPFFSKKRIRNVTLFEIENKERKKNELSLMSGCCYATFRRLPPLFAQKFARKPFDNA